MGLGFRVQCFYKLVHAKLALARTLHQRFNDPSSRRISAWPARARSSRTHVLCCHRIITLPVGSRRRFRLFGFVLTIRPNLSRIGGSSLMQKLACLPFVQPTLTCGYRGCMGSLALSLAKSRNTRISIPYLGRLLEWGVQRARLNCCGLQGVSAVDFPDHNPELETALHRGGAATRRSGQYEVAPQFATSLMAWAHYLPLTGSHGSRSGPWGPIGDMYR